MKRFAFLFLLSACTVGCSLFQTVGLGSPVMDVPVFVAHDYTLEKAVLAAASRRQWIPVKTSDNVYRLTIRQRNNICSVDVIMQKDSFSIIPVESNIPVRKCNQWVLNLQREICHRAQRGR